MLISSDGKTLLKVTNADIQSGLFDIPGSVTDIGETAFKGCTSLTHINIPGSVITIGNSAFQNCSNLILVNLPSSVKSIGKFAFQGCYLTIKIEADDTNVKNLLPSELQQRVVSQLRYERTLQIHNTALQKIINKKGSSVFHYLSDNQGIFSVIDSYAENVYAKQFEEKAGKIRIPSDTDSFDVYVTEIVTISTACIEQATAEYDLYFKLKQAQTAKPEASETKKESEDTLPKKIKEWSWPDSMTSLSAKNNKLELASLEIDGSLGKQTFMCTHRKNGKSCVLKKYGFKKNPLPSDEKRKDPFKREKDFAKFQSLNETPNVVDYHDVDNEYAICLELFGQSLDEFIIKNTLELTWLEYYEIFLQIAVGIKTIHKAFIHGDIKPSNILMDEKRNIKVADLGSSIRIEDSSVVTDWDHGTSHFMPPELLCEHIECRGAYKPTKASDIYSFGCTMWCLISGLTTPFEKFNSLNAMNVVFLNAALEKGEREPIPKDCPNELSKLISACWAQNPLERPEIETCIQRLQQMIADEIKNSQHSKAQSTRAAATTSEYAAEMKTTGNQDIGFKETSGVHKSILAENSLLKAPVSSNQPAKVMSQGCLPH